MLSTAELWILLIPIPECEVFVQCTECPYGSYWEQLPGVEWLPQGERQKWPVSIWKIFSQSNPSGLIEYFQNISSELNFFFFNPGGHLKIVVSAPSFVLLSALWFHR